MHLTRSEVFALFDSHLCNSLRVRAREQGDKVAVRLLNALIFPAAKRARGQLDVDLSPRSLWQWHVALKHGLCLTNVGPAIIGKLAELVALSEDDV